MNPKLEETIVLDFITSNATGAAADADSLPTAAVYEDANDTPILAPTVVKRTSLTGNYRVSIACTAANGFEAAKSYNVVVSATIGGVASKAVLRSYQMRTRSIDDASTFAGGAVASVTAGVTVTTNSDKTGYALSGTQVFDNTGTWTGSLTGSVGSVTTKTGYSLAAAGLDAVVVEVGVNARQALAVIGAATAGKGTGLDGSTAVYYAMSNPATTRITATLDGEGNRSVVTLAVPT